MIGLAKGPGLGNLGPYQGPRGVGVNPERPEAPAGLEKPPQAPNGRNPCDPLGPGLGRFFAGLLPGPERLLIFPFRLGHAFGMGVGRAGRLGLGPLTSAQISPGPGFGFVNLPEPKASGPVARGSVVWVSIARDKTGPAVSARHLIDNPRDGFP